MTPSEPMDPTARLWTAIVGVLCLAILALAGPGRGVDAHVHQPAAAAECGARGAMAVPTLGGPYACIDSATLVALPARRAP